MSLPSSSNPWNWVRSPQYVPTEEQAADMLTKTLSVVKFTEFRDKVMGLKAKQVHFNTQKFTKV